MATQHRIYLVPGFFGFARFGQLSYFSHVESFLRQAFVDKNLAVEVHYARPLPTGPLSKRAAQLLQCIAETASDDDRIHIVGHSTGGLDARLLASPRVQLPTTLVPEAAAAQIRSVVSIATPHHGTPLAGLFTSLLGQHILRVLSLLTLHGFRLGRVPLPALISLAGALPSAKRLQGPLVAVLDQVYRQLLKDFDEERQKQIEAFFRETSADQALLPQLSCECTSLFNSAVSDRPTTRYGCVVTQGRPPTWRSNLDLGLSPTLQAMYTLYRGLHDLAGDMPEAAFPALDGAMTAALTSAFGSVPNAAANDAIVPTRSQLHGELIHAAWADHLDVVGHFHGPAQEPPHVDWLTTRSGFNRNAFEVLWSEVAAFLVAAAA